MKKKLIPIGILIIVLLITLTINKVYYVKEPTVHELKATILKKENDKLTIVDEEDNIYTLEVFDNSFSENDIINLTYCGLLDKNKPVQDIEIKSYEVTKVENETTPDFLANYKDLAKDYLKNLSLDEKIGQVLLARYDENDVKNALTKYHLGGYIFFSKDFENKAKDEVINMINESQSLSKIPLLTAVDEEGGVVTRVSQNKNLSPEKFKSSSDLYQEGGFSLIKDDTIKKSKLLYSLGLNLNLAPVVDVSLNPDDYMYNRSINLSTSLTSTYAKTVIEASKKTGVSYTLKHFPGYGNNDDTHNGKSIDNRDLESIKENDLPPFIEGIKSEAESILVSHNIVTNIDPDNPASLSKPVHNLLLDDLNFQGIIISDDLDMGALSDISNKYVKAILSLNDLIIITDYQSAFTSIKNAINDKTLSEEDLDNHVIKIIAWKFYKGLISINEK